MNKETAKKLGELAILCAQLNREKFTVTYRFIGGSSIVDVSVNPNGYSDGCGVYGAGWFDVREKEAINHIKETIMTLKKLSEESLVRHAPENKAARDAARAAKLIEERKRIDAEIKSLGGDTLVCNGE